MTTIGATLERVILVVVVCILAAFLIWEGGEEPEIQEVYVDELLQECIEANGAYDIEEIYTYPHDIENDYRAVCEIPSYTLWEKSLTPKTNE